ncbi:MAG: hypothetical protein UX87_C0043G0005 [Candidatus Amesbacteria bacterium GW2011_GWA1_47_16]|uniref:Large ribosomal subunit protein uL1 n=4 Tax=Candidatus Amesiibacteriota TaxID=1752730 RepID=A0A0G1U9V2_9BACT|nr:MAG: hypothetical protein UX87_C0043G0005 [Candidatus Amesbacteria bacterium GW2011_GWA1_47_16]KKU62933.1 MAG: 50S ribosomal protein L1 [Candidatus Amesbacteria bacterium GW2011_GWC1_47_15]KKU97415.1 MAG: hypothetical protein UY28_C0021G0002 [Candidatus Amesbacteria bacterium GW2011_GWB1_48_13]OGC99129.1 MAG: hypothetical protein A2701_00845 [Candidatus Amesbacteria bacterium RIFCSPHIGHO2_01_FULL_47_34]OGD01490.1 MAG: hypothetical protein A2972_02940 [Candidatus Amesbacteria bacterium RIFCSP
MGKKRITVLGSEEETSLKAKKAVKLEQKKLREGQTISNPVKSAVRSVPVIEAQINTGVTPTLVPLQKTGEISARRVRVRSKSYQAAKSQIDADRKYTLAEGLGLLRKVTLAKFDGTVELHINLKDKGLTKSLNLPHSSGKTRRVAVADADTLTKIESGKIDFDILLATPAQMAGLVKFAKVLGPRGLMPNPKNGTVVPDPEAAAKKLSGSNTVQLKTDKDAPVVHTTVGKLSQKDKELEENIRAIVSYLPAVQKVVLKSTMSPAIKLEI